MKTKGLFGHAVTQEVVVLLNSDKAKVPTHVGASWQPDVAQFLLDMFPDALEYGLDLSDIAEMVAESGEAVVFGTPQIADFDDGKGEKL